MCLVKNKFFNMILKRLLDIFSSFFLLVLLSPLIIIIAILIKCDSQGSVLFWSIRFGKNKCLFKMPKFRSMSSDAPIVDTKNFKDSYKFVTKIGKFLRITSLDEIPQLFSVIKGDMSLVGPRPALYTQDDLIDLRDKYQINSFRPGITGFAQINGRDNLSLKKKVSLEVEYMKNHDICLDIKIILITIFGLKWLKDISH